jgi:hypothetical protein
VQQWFLGVQHDIGSNTMVEVNYIGNTGRSLTVTSDVNRFNGSAFLGRPNANVGRVFLTETSAKSFYHSLQINVNRRYSNGFTANFSYNYSHAIDEVSDPLRGVAGSNNATFGFANSEALIGPMEVRNFRLDRGSADFDLRHRAVFNAVYELPFFKDQGGGITGLLGGWQINSIITLQSGSPFTVFAANDANGDLIFNDRAVYLGRGQGQAIIDDPKESGLRYLNGALFVPGSSAGFNNSGALGRNVFTGPHFYNVDFALAKNTKLSEGTNLQFRVESFNLFNRTNFTNPSGNISNPATFGLLTNTYNPRMVQLAIRLQF